MVEYNLTQYLKDTVNFADYPFSVNGVPPVDNDPCILVQGSGVKADAENLLGKTLVRFISYDATPLKALWPLNELFTALRSLYATILPEVTAGDFTLPEIEAYQISPMAAPQYIGADNSMHTAVLNVRVLTK